MMKSSKPSQKSTTEVVFSKIPSPDLNISAQENGDGDLVDEIDDATLKPPSSHGLIESGGGDLVAGPSKVDNDDRDLKPSSRPKFPSTLSSSLTDETDPSWRWRKRYGEDVDWEEMEERWEADVTSRNREMFPSEVSPPIDSLILSPSVTENSDPSWRWRKRYGEEVDWEILEEKWDMEVTSKNMRPSSSSSPAQLNRKIPVLSPAHTDDTDPSWKWLKRYGEDVNWEFLEERWEKEVISR